MLFLFITAYAITHIIMFKQSVASETCFYFQSLSVP